MYKTIKPRKTNDTYFTVNYVIHKLFYILVILFSTFIQLEIAILLTHHIS